MALRWGKKMAGKKDDNEDMSMEEILASIRKYVTNEPSSEQGEHTPTESHDPESLVVPPKNVNYQRQDTLSGSPVGGQVKAPLPRTETEFSPTSSQLSQPEAPQVQTPHDNESILELTNPLDDEDEDEVKTNPRQNFGEYTSSLRSSPSTPPTTLGVKTDTKGEALSSQTQFSNFENEEGLTSSETVSASASALSRLKEVTQPDPVHSQKSEKQGTSPTLDQLIHDLAKPLVKEWLDKNLSTMVEDMVSKEIERITRQMKK